jgi:hypothetical protein
MGLKDMDMQSKTTNSLGNNVILATKRRALVGKPIARVVMRNQR